MVESIDEAIKIMNKKVRNSYARQYLDGIVDAIENDGTEGLRTQLLCMLDHLDDWKGKQAKEVKEFVKKWIKTHKK